VIFWAQVIAGFAAGVALLGPAKSMVDAVPDFGGKDDPPALEVSQAHLQNTFPSTAVVGDELVYAESTAPGIEITIDNHGEEPVLLDEAKVTIEDSARFTPCLYGGGGDLPSSRSYTVFLPVLPLPEERVRRRRLHEEVPAKRADRFVLRFATPPDSVSDHLYAVRVELLPNGDGEPLPVGRFVLGVPAPPSEGGHLFPQSDDSLRTAAYQRSTRLASVWCYRRNLAELKRLLARPGERSREVASLAHLQLASGWPHFAGDRSARASIEPLFEVDVAEAPILAVFAAEQTGDQSVLEQTQARAVQALLKWSRRDLDYEDPSGAAMDARAALSMESSVAAEAALRRAETALRVREEERDELEAGA